MPLDFKNYRLNLFTVEGQIVLILCGSERSAGDLYKNINASQPTISKAISKLTTASLIEARTDERDRRLIYYKISEDLKMYLREKMRCILEMMDQS